MPKGEGLRMYAPARFASLSRVFFLGAALSGAITHVSEARAQAVGIIDLPSRSVGLRPESELPYWISRQDCVADDVFTFDVPLSGPFTAYTLEVWAGQAD